MVMTTLTSEAIWSELTKDARTRKSQGVIKRLVGSNLACPLFFGIKIPENLHCFIVQLPSNEMQRFHEIAESRGFALTTYISGDELDNDHSTLAVTASSQYYNDIFKTIADDISKNTAGIDSSNSKASALFRRITLWQVFFEKQGKAGFSTTAQQGLYGELYFLYHHLLKQNSDLQRILRGWTGPDSRQHDFQYGNYAIEVKTISQRKHRTAEITSEQQLDDSQTQNLFLYWLSVSVIENGKETLPALVNEIRNFLSEQAVPAGIFEESLLASGYADADRDLYDSRSYTVQPETIYEVKDEFPRIRASELRKGVADVRYSIAESACAPCEIDVEEFHKKLWGI